MKFKKNEDIYDTIEEAHEAFKCPGMCNVDCPLNQPSWAYGRRSRGHICNAFVEDKPLEAARLMGYEVVEEEPVEQKHSAEEKEKPIKNTKPLSEWTLRELREYCAQQPHCCTGCRFSLKDGCMTNVEPERWDLAPKPRFTPEEVAFAKALSVAIPDGVLMRDAAGTLSWDVPGDTMTPWEENRLPYKLFPSIPPGQIVKLGDIAGGGV